MINVLKASAGTGKTYRLSLEYVANLVRGQDFEEIVVMTFTRKATAEIRTRILDHLADILDNPDTSQVRANIQEIYPQLEINLGQLETVYRRMRQNKDQIKVYTIDSFINQIFKQAIAPYLNVYDYQIVGAGENEALIEVVFKRVLDNEADFQQLEQFLTANLERDVGQYIGLLKKILNNRWKFLLFDPQSAEKRVVGDLVKQFTDCIETLQKIAAEKDREFGPDHFRKPFRAYFDLAEGQVKNWLVDNYKLFIKKTFWNGNKTRGKSVKHLKEALAFEYENFRRQLAAKVYNQELLPYQKQIISFSQRIFEIYDQIKFREQKFTHADISNYTYQYLYQAELDLLSGSEVSSYFCELLGTDVNTLLIDEFQDTSVLQWKILQPLINYADQLAAVGDEKQSIYSWRGGEKELFANLEDILAGSSETLATSYRSHQQVVEFINRFFSDIHPEWNYEPVEHLPDKDGGYVEVLVGGQKGEISTDTKKFAQKSEAEQQQVKELNQQLTTDLPAEIAATIEEKVDNYGQVGILARKNDDLKQIARELDERGISYVLASQDSLVEHQAVQPLYFLTSYLAYGDYFDLVKFLRSDVVGINGDELKYILTNRKQIEDYLAGGEIELPRPELKASLSLVRELSDLDFEVLSQYMIEQLGIVDNYVDNANALKNVYQYFELMKEFTNLIDFMSYLEENKDSDELKQVAVEDSEAVQLLTIHKAKGLSFTTEFFYWDISSGGGYYGDNLEFYLELDDQFAEVTDYLLTNSRYNKLLEYVGLDFYQQQQQREFMEEINNVYVALTRAEKNLFLYVDVPKKFADKWEVADWAGKDYELYEKALLRGCREDYLKSLVTGKKFGSWQESSSQSENDEVEIPELEKYFAPSVSRQKEEAEATENLDLAQEGSRLLGLAIHYYLEQIKYDTPKERELARSLVRAKYGNVVGSSGLKETFKRAESFVADNSSYFSDRWEVFTEYEIIKEGVGYRIDRLLVDKEEKRIVILDYKTGDSREQNQLATYRKLISDQLNGEYEIKTKFLKV